MCTMQNKYVFNMITNTLLGYIDAGTILPLRLLVMKINPSFRSIQQPVPPCSLGVDMEVCTACRRSCPFVRPFQSDQIDQLFNLFGINRLSKMKKALHIGEGLFNWIAWRYPSSGEDRAPAFKAWPLSCARCRPPKRKKARYNSIGLFYWVPGSGPSPRRARVAQH